MVHYNNEETVAAGKLLATTSPDDEIVISGLSGVYPNSENVLDLSKNLYAKEDLVDVGNRRWGSVFQKIPSRSATLLSIDKFDAANFGIHYQQAEYLNPTFRIMLEKVYDALFEAGVNPESIKGTNTGVFVGCFNSDIETPVTNNCKNLQGFIILGNTRAVAANRISHLLGVNGPSYTVDTACSSSVTAMYLAYKAIRNGECDAAIVAGSNILLTPNISTSYLNLSAVSPDGLSKPFDETANGYSRAECVSAIYLQKRKNAKRVFATLIHCKLNSDGFKPEGVTYPSTEMQKQLMVDFYTECEVQPDQLAWMEAHGTGTKVGDVVEANSIANAICLHRRKPLLIGSVKSNLGHSESSSIFSSISKVIVAMEYGKIPPNMHFVKPQKIMEHLFETKLQVITKSTPWNGGMVGINNFGIGGSNGHILLKWNEKRKINGGKPDDNLARLVTFSCRTYEAATYLSSELEKMSLDIEFVKLLHEVYKINIPSNIYRGYIILNNETSSKRKRITRQEAFSRSAVIHFPGILSHLEPIDTSLLVLPIISTTLKELSVYVKIDLITLLKQQPRVSDSLVSVFLRITALQICLVNILKTIGIKVDRITGISIGEIGCAYADGVINEKVAILTSYHIALGILESKHKLKQGSVITHNTELNYKGLRNITDKFSDKPPNGNYRSAAEGNVSAKNKETSNVALHSNIVKEIYPNILNGLQKMFTDKKLSSKKWFNKQMTYEYFSSIIFNEIEYNLPDVPEERDAVHIVLGPPTASKSFLSVGKRINNIYLLNKNCEHFDQLTALLDNLGSIYLEGVSMDLSHLYPPVALPVSRSTPLLSPLIKWDHTENWWESLCDDTNIKKISEECFETVTVKHKKYHYIFGHVIDGKVLFPATGYIFLVWKIAAALLKKTFYETPVVLEDINFHRATSLTDESSIKFTTLIQKSTGKFEIMEGDVAVVSGKIYFPEEIKSEMALNAVDSADIEFEMTADDIYKELRLRGYQYKDLFRSLTKLNFQKRCGKIKWANNWVAFADNLLQMKIIFRDTRSLFVPTYIGKVTFNPKEHFSIASQLPEDGKDIMAYYYEDIDLIKSGGLEIKNLKASAINKKKNLNEPVLEKYIFVPYHDLSEKFTITEIIRIMIQIILENEEKIVIKVAEFYDSKSALLSPIINQALGDLPLLQADSIVITNGNENELINLPPEISVSDRVISDESALIVVASNLILESRKDVLERCMNSVKPEGFIITVENKGTTFNLDNVIVIASYTYENKSIFLLRKKRPVKVSNDEIISCDCTNFNWVSRAKEAISSENTNRIIFYSDKDQYNGILGFINCLKKESDGKKSRCILIMDETAPNFTLSDQLYAKQMENDLIINVFKDGKWGSYRHLLIDENKPVMSSYCFVDIAVKGNLSTLTWIEGDINKRYPKNENEVMVNVAYAPLNFRDVMEATGKISTEALVKGRINNMSAIGLEFSGYLDDGTKVFGTTTNCLATKVKADRLLCWPVPEYLTLEEAATLPCVYCTVLYAFFVSGNVERGSTILIHSAAGGVGQAAINVATYMGCRIFVTVGTQEKVEFIKQTFPQIAADDIGSSRDTSFENMIMKQTNGRGVDVVLNSLAEEKLFASVKCLANGGQFFEIGKFDLINDNQLGEEIFRKGASFHGIMFDKATNYEEHKRRVSDIFCKFLKLRVLKPLRITIFGRNQVEEAFRYMAAGKHIGKVLIKINDFFNGDVINNKSLIEAKTKYYCDEYKTFIIAGGLGGFGLELADWLVLRGCKKLLLSSRRALVKGYESLRINFWKSSGVTVQISTEDITTEEGVKQLLINATKLGPVGGIFNLAVVLSDGLFEDQSKETFELSAGPKAVATFYLDKWSRKLCPELESFVVFSSVSCGRGNVGQTNYGLSNSVMERIIEKRKEDNLPALAVQWGAVGDVGLVAKMNAENKEVVIGGTLQQSITNCLNVMDNFMRQSEPIVSSIVVAEKKSFSSSSNIVDCVADILGLVHTDNISQSATLTELGLDSMAAVEIQQTLEREYDLIITPKEIRVLTLSKLKKISGKEANLSIVNPKNENISFNFDYLANAIKTFKESKEAQAELFQKWVRLPSLETKDGQPLQKVFIFPGLEGFAETMKLLSKQLLGEVYCYQYNITKNFQTVEEMVEEFLNEFIVNINDNGSFTIIGYSFGSLVAFDLMKKLEAIGQHCIKLICIDGSPEFCKSSIQSYITEHNNIDDVKILKNYAIVFVPERIDKIKEIFSSEDTWEQNTEKCIRLTEGSLPFTVEYQKNMLTSIRNRVKTVLNYKPTKSLKSTVYLIKAVEQVLDLMEDFEISKNTTGEVETFSVEGNHVTMLNNPALATIINNINSVKT